MQSELGKIANTFIYKLFGTRARFRSFNRVTVIITTPDQVEFSATANTKWEAEQLVYRKIIDYYWDLIVNTKKG